MQQLTDVKSRPAQWRYSVATIWTATITIAVLVVYGFLVLNAAQAFHDFWGFGGGD